MNLDEEAAKLRSGEKFELYYRRFTTLEKGLYYFNGESLVFDTGALVVKFGKYPEQRRALKVFLELTEDAV
jgi:hypothetical protein